MDGLLMAGRCILASIEDGTKASYQPVFDPPHAAIQDQRSYIACLSGLVKNAPTISV
jgi:hypothetical protein